MTNLLTIKEACGILRISRMSLSRLRSAGKIKSIIVSARSVRISQAEVDRYISKSPAIATCHNLRGRKPKQVAVDAVAAV